MFEISGQVQSFGELAADAVAQSGGRIGPAAILELLNGEWLTEFMGGHARELSDEMARIAVEKALLVKTAEGYQASTPARSIRELSAAFRVAFHLAADAFLNAIISESRRVRDGWVSMVSVTAASGLIHRNGPRCGYIPWAIFKYLESQGILLSEHRNGRMWLRLIDA